MASFLEQVGARLRQQRELKGYTGNEVAVICKISVSMLFLVERGAHKPPFSFYEDVCRAIGVTMEDVLAGFKWTYIPPTQGKGDKAA